MKEIFDIEDVIAAECSLEPLKCRHCGHVGEVTFFQYIGDGHCAWCGEWQKESQC